MLKKFLLLFILLLLCGCSNYVIKNSNYSKVSPNSIIINEININKVVNISSIDDEVNGIVMFSEYGRPDEEGTNTIIAAHSGYGENALFNNLNKLEINDEIIIIYNNKEYVYLVNNVYEVDEYDTSVLGNMENTSLTLMTCKKGDSSKRIIAVSVLDSVIDM
ncbi:MAG TPA: sortase [Bacilli bacterium]|nr:sortase [Bacilli bacterium]